MNCVMFIKILKVACFQQLKALHVSGSLTQVLNITETTLKWSC